MMLYEAVHLQQTETYYDFQAKMKDKPKVQRTKSANNVNRFMDQQNVPIARRGSYVVGQKLRESKWFTHEELKVFCAVIETGFIVQLKNEKDEIEYGIAVWNLGEEKSKNPDYIKIYSLIPHKTNFKICSFDLLYFWPQDTKLRIFNQSDKTESPHSEEIIRDQIAYAESTKQKWHSTEHFTYWCRYGPIQINQRVRNIMKRLGQAMSVILLLSGKGLLARDINMKFVPTKKFNARL